MTADPSSERARAPLSFVFFLLHPGYVRYFAPVLRELATRGHRIHLTFALLEKDSGDTELVRQLLDELPLITTGPAPARAPRDGWRAVALLIRSLADLARYSHPRYASAPALRERIRRRFRTIVDDGPGLRAPARFVLRRMIDRVSARRSAPRADALVSLLAALERAVPTAPAVDSFLVARHPDAVVASPVIDFASPLVEPLKSARSLGIPSAVAVASWDNLTGKGLLRVVPDRVFVWNESQCEEAAEMHAIPRERLVVTGAPKFDEWFARRPSRSATDFAARVGLPAAGHVLYVCSSPFIAPDEVGFVRAWLDRLRAHEALRDWSVLVRPHPQNAMQWLHATLEDLAPAAVWPREGAQPDAGEARADFFDSLTHAVAVVGVNTSALIEAAIVGKPVLTVLDERFQNTQEGTLHFQYLLHENGGFLHVARDLDEHVDQLESAVAAGGERADRFVERFVRPLGRDVVAAEVMADELEALAVLHPVERQRYSRALRLALRPLAFAAHAIARERDGDAATVMLAE